MSKTTEERSEGAVSQVQLVAKDSDPKNNNVSIILKYRNGYGQNAGVERIVSVLFHQLTFQTSNLQ